MGSERKKVDVLKQLAFTNLGMRKRDLGPKFLRFTKDSPLFDSFLNYALDFCELQMKNDAMKKGRGSPDMVASEIQARIEEATRLMSESYLLVLMSESDYTANLVDQRFFEIMFRFTNKVLEAQFGRKIRDDPIARIALAGVFRSANFNVEQHAGEWQSKPRPTRPNVLITPAMLAREDAKYYLEKNRKNRTLQPLGVVMRARSPLLSMKLPSFKEKAKNYAAQTDRHRNAKVPGHQHCRPTTQACIAGKCKKCFKPLSPPKAAPRSKSAMAGGVAAKLMLASQPQPTSLPSNKPQKETPRLESCCSPVGIGGKLRLLMRKLDFDIHSVRGDEVVDCIMFMFEEYGLLKHLKIKDDQFRSFVLELRSHHTMAHPFHSWTTSVSICHMVYYIMTVGGASQFLSLTDLFALLLTALSMGIGHSGVSYPVLIQSEEDFKSLMEWSSPELCPKGVGILQEIKRLGSQPHCNIMSAISSKQQQSVFETIAELYTQLSIQEKSICTVEETHGVGLMNFKPKPPTPLPHTNRSPPIFLQDPVAPEPKSAPEPVLPRKDERTKLTSWILYAAQYNYATRSVPIARRLAGMHQEQCWRQGEMNQESRTEWLPKSCDRTHGKDPTYHLGFVEKIVAPAYLYLSQKLPNMRKPLFNVARYKAFLRDQNPSAQDIDLDVLEMEEDLRARQRAFEAAGVAAHEQQLAKEALLAAARELAMQEEEQKNSEPTISPVIQILESIRPLTAKSEREAVCLSDPVDPEMEDDEAVPIQVSLQPPSLDTPKEEGKTQPIESEVAISKPQATSE